MLTTNQKGAIAESAIAAEATRLGIGVLRPLYDLRYDLVFDTGDRLLRVQCKWAARSGDVLTIKLCGFRRTRDGMRRTDYDAGEIDAFAAYSIDTGRCYWFPFDELAGKRQVQLRLAPTRNNQAAGVRWAREAEFAATLSVAGP